jgi:signal peptide peptidase SppA
MLDDIWIGSEASYKVALEAKAKCDKYFAEKGRDDEERERPSEYLQITDGVGVISVEGSLYDGTFGVVGKWFGITGYGDIQQALVQAVQHADVRSILLMVKSGGGSVAGVGETAQLIQAVDKHKPVTTYSPSTMASAALWLGLGGRKILASPTALVGSIGTLMVMVSRHRQLKEDGIDAIVVRSGKYKALGHPVEPLNDEAIAEAQEKADYYSDIFLTYVAERRGVNKASADTRFGQGRTFIGEQAKAVGLVDAVVGYSEAFLSAKSQALPDNKPKVFGASSQASTTSADNASEPKGQTSMSNPHIPSDAELAAMAAGVALTPEQDAALKAAAGAITGAATEEKPATDTPTLETVMAELEAAKLTAAESETKLEALVGELGAATQQVADMTAQIAELTAKLIPLDGLCAIVRNGVTSMSVPLNLPAADLSALSGADLLAKHKEVSDKFTAKYRVGGVAATTKPSTEQDKPATQTVNPLFAAAAQIQSQRKGA